MKKQKEGDKLNKKLKMLIGVICIIAIIIIGKLYKDSGFSLSKEKEYGVSSSNPIAVKVGMDVLNNGGNAVDASVAIAYVLGVVEPYASGIGGGGGMMVYSPKDNTSKFYDYREYAPISNDNKVSNIGVPGFVKGMEYVHNIYGKIEMKNLLEPAINYSKEGFLVDDYSYNRFDFAKKKLKKFKIPQFFHNGEPKEIGSLIVQEDLANTLMEIQKHGADTFYSGKISKNITDYMKWDKDDLKEYSVLEHEPVKSKFNDYDIISAPPPFSGTTLIQILKLADYLDIKKYENNELEYIKIMSKIVNAAYKDRINNIGDLNYNNINYQNIVDDEYVKKMINSNELYGDYEKEHESTTHFVVADKDGMIVSCTNTLGDFFGSGDYLNGFFLNNALFNFDCDSKNSINSYKPGKRSRTFMSPTIIKNNDFVMGIGSPGGNKIPQAMAQVIIKNLIFKHKLDDSIDDNRIVFEDLYKITTEEELKKEEEEILQSEGYEIKTNESKLYFGSIQVMVNNYKNGVFGGADYRRHGKWDAK